MSERLRSVRRIVKVQAQMQQLAEWRLIETENRIRDAAAARSDLDGFIEQSQSVGSLAMAALKQVARLAERQAHLAADREERLREHNHAQRRRRGSELVAESLAQSDRQAEERKSLEAIMEAVMARSVDAKL